MFSHWQSIRSFATGLGAAVAVAALVTACGPEDADELAVDYGAAAWSLDPADQLLGGASDLAAALTGGQVPNTCLEVSFGRTGGTETSAELAQTFVAAEEGYPVAVRLLGHRTAAADSGARLVVEVRKGTLVPAKGTTPASYKIPATEAAGTTIARGEIPFSAVPAADRAFSVRLSATGGVRKITKGRTAAPDGFAVVVRVVGGATAVDGSNTLTLGCESSASTGILPVSTRSTTRTGTGAVSKADFVARTPEARLTFSVEGAAAALDSCADGAKGPLEPDTDCGNLCEARCAQGKRCWVDADCVTGVCGPAETARRPSTWSESRDPDCSRGECLPGVCLSPRCANRVRDAVTGETDVDCGGTVCQPRCARGRVCKVDADCDGTKSLICVKATAGATTGRCQPASCGNGAKDGSETDVDCGGASCAPCEDTKACAQKSDCLSNLCAGGACVVPSCVDKTQNGDETGIDCGGTCANPFGKPCAVGLGCSINADCKSNNCVDGKCALSLCTNGKVDPGESDADCGSVCNKTCRPFQMCKFAHDCPVNFECRPVGDGTIQKCVPQTCASQIRDGAETDVDCGGPSCRACADGAKCKEGKDCANSVCKRVNPKDTYGVCRSSCADRVRNGGESDVDCGAVCAGTGAGLDFRKLCPVNRRCTQNGDCQSGQCNPRTLRCADTCFDGDKNGYESSIDVGGACDQKATVGSPCRVPADCQTGSCNPATQTCQEAACNDGIANQDESGLDCGGLTCSDRCQAGRSCRTANDCAAGLACSEAGACVASTCSDGLKGGDETDLDCGGACALLATPAKCAVGKRCRANGDCANANCVGATATAAGFCRDISCSNGVADTGETGLDCGGPKCQPCITGDVCKAARDCESGVCNLKIKPSVCVAPTRTDKVKNGVETDVDCGGDVSGASACATVRLCRVGTDCQSGICDPDTRRCAAPSCYDAVQNGGETAVDCGGPGCDRCPAGRSCTKNSECLSFRCLLQPPDGAQPYCLPASSTDGLQNGEETDVDCGGPAASGTNRCATNLRCRAHSDCSSGECRNYFCR